MPLYEVLKVRVLLLKEVGLVLQFEIDLLELVWLVIGIKLGRIGECELPCLALLVLEELCVLPLSL